MKLKEIYSDDNELHVIVEDSGESFMNLIRRTSSFGIKTFAIEDVTFNQNNSALYDEILAHRLGLLPLKVNKDIFTLKKPELHFTLNVEGPKVVRASDLVTKGKGVEVLNPHTPIVVLSKDQKLEFTATAIIGTGVEHSKWSAGNVFYFRYPSAAKGNESLEELRKMIDAEPIGKLKNQPTKFILVVESWGQLTPKEMLNAAFENAKASLKEIKLK
jgi:DNA-directed RNA polymerase subunit D